MRFKPMTDDEIKKASPDDFSIPLPRGVYEAEVIEAEDQVSKKKIKNGKESGGQEMLMIKLKVNNRHIYDYISPHFFQHKWKHFFKSAGKMEYYEKGEVSAEDVLHWRILAILEIKPSTKEGYGDQNGIFDYVLESEVEGVLNRPSGAVRVVENPSDLPF